MDVVTLLPGATVFDSAESFAMTRGSRADVSNLDPIQVYQAGTSQASHVVVGKTVKSSAIIDYPPIFGEVEPTRWR